MPAIAVYKHGTTLVPVDGTKLSTGYQCPWTDQLFDTKRQYVAHLAKLRKTRMHKNAQQRQRGKIFNEFINQPTFDDIIKWIESHPTFFFDGIAKNAWWQTTKGLDKHREKFTIKIDRLKLNWQDNVSNSHDCPRGGVENFCREPDKPTGYPGWRGRIEFTIPQFGNSYFGSDVFNLTGIHTGTGGGNGKNYGYDVRFFASDWPQLEKMAMEKRDEYTQKKVENVLRHGWNSTSFDIPFVYGVDKK